MTLLTVTELREHINSDLGDDALQRLLDAAEAAIVARVGAPGARTEFFDGGRRYLPLSRPVGTITSVTEAVYPNGTGTTLALNDYLVRGTYLLERFSGGTNSRWSWDRRITVVYTPVDDTALREGVQIDLIKLGLSYNPGLTQLTIGTWSEAYAANSVWNNSEEYAAILSRLDPEPQMAVVG